MLLRAALLLAVASAWDIAEESPYLAEKHLDSATWTPPARAAELLMFYSPTCPACKRGLPRIEEIARELEQGFPPVRTRLVDVATDESRQHREFVAKFGVTGVPAYFTAVDGAVSEYRHDLNKMPVNLLEAARLSFVHEAASEAELRALVEGAPDECTVVGSFAAADAEAERVFREETHRDCMFVVDRTSSGGTTEIRVHRGSLDDAVAYAGDHANPDELDAFVIHARLKPVTVLTEHTRNAVFRSPFVNHVLLSAPRDHPGLPAALAACETAHLEGGFERLGSEAPRFVLVHPDDDADLLDFFGLTNDLDQLHVIATTLDASLGRRKYVLRGPAGDPDAVIDFVWEALRDGPAAAPLLRSLPAPEEPWAGPGSVRAVVADTLAEITRDPAADVLLFYFSPGCPHCLALAPVFHDVAAQIADEAPGVQLAMVNGEENEFAFGRVPAYPYLELYRADNKDEPVNFKSWGGAPSAEELVEFLRAHASTVQGGGLVGSGSGSGEL